MIQYYAARLPDAGYRYITYSRSSGYHILRNERTGQLEEWTKRKYGAKSKLLWRNTHLEFVAIHIIPGN